MHVEDIQATVPRVAGVAVKAGGFIRRRKRQTVAVVVAALLVGPLVTTDGELVFLNAFGLGLGALLLRRFARTGGRKRTGQAKRTQRQQAKQTAEKQLKRGGHDDDASGDDWWDWDKATGRPGSAGGPADGGAVRG